MKKILSLILILVCAFALFSCGGDDDDKPDFTTIEDLNKMYNAIAPSRVDTVATQTFGKYTLTSTSTLKTGVAVDGFSVTLYTYSKQQMRTVEDGSGVDVLKPIETVTGEWVYHEDKGYRENGGDWDATGVNFTPETGAIALNMTEETVKDYLADEETKTITFTVAAENIEAVFGVAFVDLETEEISVTITHSGADITSVSIAYTIINPENDEHPEIAVTLTASYAYDSQEITID